MKVPFVLSHGKGRSFVGGGGELVNAYAQAAPTGTKEAAWLIGCPGTALFAQLLFDNEKIAAIQPAFGDKAVVVTDLSTYVLSADGTYTRLGAGLSGKVSTASNGVTVAAVNGTTGLWITASSVTVIADADFEPADTVAFLAGFFVFTQSGTGRYFITELYGIGIDGLDFATAESAPDNLVAVVALRRELWLLGTETVEVHSLTGGSFPFGALTGVSITFGCVAPFSAIAVDQSVCWFAPNGIVYQSQGYGPLRISTHEIEEELTEIRDAWGDAFAWTYVEDGHQFYMLTVGGRTYGFDFATRLWHRRDTGGTGRHAANCAATVWNKVLVGDDRGRVLHLAKDYLDDAGVPMTVTMGSLPFRREGYFSVPSFEVDAEVGNGGVATLETSEDDGHTWSDRLEADMGAVGDYLRSLHWDQLGMFHKDFRARVRVSGNFRKRVAAAAEVRVA